LKHNYIASSSFKLDSHLLKLVYLLPVRSEVYSLKQELRWHVNNGCKVVDPNNGGVIAAGGGQSPDSTTTVTNKAAVPMPPNKAYLQQASGPVMQNNEYL
jgi:hypothetical protein